MSIHVKLKHLLENSTEHAYTPLTQQEKRKMYETIKSFNKFRQSLKAETVYATAGQIMEVVNLAERYALKESGDWMQAKMIERDMKEVKKDAAKLFAENKYREYMELHGLSVQLTEALAEHWHARIREELEVRNEDAPDLAGILDQGYRGSRYSFGYPACPDIEQQVQLCELLEPGRIGVELSEEFQLHPEQSTSAIIVHHPEAKYFNAN